VFTLQLHVYLEQFLYYVTMLQSMSFYDSYLIISKASSRLLGMAGNKALVEQSMPSYRPRPRRSVACQASTED
jgi:hypothetical protein